MRYCNRQPCGLTTESLRMSADLMTRIDGDRDHMNTSRLTCGQVQGAFRLMLIAADQIDRRAKLIRSLMEEKPWVDQPWARCALAIAASALTRGRLLTDGEKLENLAAAMEDDAGDSEEERAANRRAAAKLRQMASLPSTKGYQK